MNCRPFSSRSTKAGVLALSVLCACTPGFLGVSDTEDEDGSSASESQDTDSDTSSGEGEATASGTSSGLTTSSASTSTTESTTSGSGTATTDDPGSTTVPVFDASGIADSLESSESTGAEDPCADLVAQATPEEVALSPYPNPEAELLASESTDRAVAPEAAYDRIEIELAAIRAEYPEIAEIEARSTWELSLGFSFDDAGAAALAQGTYEAWDCLNELYAVTEIDLSRIEDLGIAFLDFTGRLNLPVVALDYMPLPNVLNASGTPRIGDGPDVCVMPMEGDDHLYIFDDAGGDCPAGCTFHTYWGFTIDADLNIDLLGTFTSAEEEPAWFTEAPDCTVYLQ